MKTNHVWIVEMKHDGKWMPTIGCALNQKDGETVLAEWKRKNPDDGFRIKQYRA